MPNLTKVFHDSKPSPSVAISTELFTLAQTQELCKKLGGKPGHLRFAYFEQLSLYRTPTIMEVEINERKLILEIHQISTEP